MGWGWNGASRPPTTLTVCVHVCLFVCVFSASHVSTCRFCFHSSPRVGLLLLMLAVLTQIVSTALLTNNINGNMLRSVDLVLSSVIPRKYPRVHPTLHPFKYAPPTYTTYLYTRTVSTEVSTSNIHDLYTHGPYSLKISPPIYTT